MADAVRVGRGRAHHRRESATSADHARALLEQGADDLGAAGWDPVYGYGLIDPRVSAQPGAGRGRREPRPRATGSSVATAGCVAFGTATHHGDLAGHPLSAPIVAAAGTPSGNGLLARRRRRRGVRVRRRAATYGSMAGRPLNAPIVGMAATPSGHGLHPARLRRRDLHVRRRGLLRIDRRPAPERADPRPHDDERRPRATGSSAPTAACSRSATRPSTVRRAACASRRR